MTIVEFFEARLAEDELTANLTIEGSPEWQVLDSYRRHPEGSQTARRFELLVSAFAAPLNGSALGWVPVHY